MKTIKWLWSITFAFLIVLFYATLTSFFVMPFSDWYLSLLKDATVPSAIIISIGWAINYILVIIILTSLIYEHRDMQGVLGIIAIGILQIVWSVVFFVGNSLLGGLIVEIAIIFMSLLTFKIIVGNKLWRAVLNAIVVGWYIYTAIAGYRILIIN